MTAPEPGWYADPATAGRLRFWDGGAWTDQTQTSPWGDSGESGGVATLAPVEAPARTLAPQQAAFLDSASSADHPPGQDRDRNRARRATIALCALIGAAVVAGLAWLLAGSSPSHRHQAAALPVGTANATAPASPPVNCEVAHHRPAPRGVISWFGSAGVKALTSVAVVPPPAGACSAADFVDPRSPGSNVVVSYPSAEAASAAAAKHPYGARPTLAHGIYVVGLSPGLNAVRGQYEAALSEYVAQTEPELTTPSSR